jgi:hypothetical protein
MNTKKGFVSSIWKCQIAVTWKVLLEFYTCNFQVTAICIFKSEYQFFIFHRIHKPLCKPAQSYGHVAPFFLSYNFNNIRIVTNKISKKYIQDKKQILFFLRSKDIKKVLMEGNGRENKKMLPTLTTLP